VAAKALDEARTADLAAVVGRTLEVGAPCPVCLQKVGAIPHREHLKSVEKAEGALAEAEAHLRIAQKKLEDAVRLKDKETVRLEGASERIVDLKLLVETYPDVEVAKVSLLEIEQAEKSVREATDSEHEARKAVDAARKVADRARVAEADARQGFEKTRDGLAPLGPPSSGGTDLSEDWRVLSSWAAAQIPALEKQASEAHAASRTAEERSLKITQELAASCDECEVVVSSGRISESVAAALATASERVERIEHAIETVERLKQEFAEAKAEHALCNSMAQHLSAKAGNFESWVVNEALQRLVGGATEILRELSDGQYSLGADDSGAFLVIDHHNADESRPARTLSGGETFLASLALALALSDQLAEMAAEGSAKLESIFLDEGFGTLDPETLAVVGESIARLAATGRMVGVITHVRELAEQIPLRFQVRKEASGSVIERLSA
jgi:exonuclease SbcC